MTAATPANAAPTTTKSASPTAGAGASATPKPNVLTIKTKTRAGNTVTKVKAACAVPNTASASAAQALCALQPDTTKSGAPIPATPTPPSTAITPTELQDAYNLPSGTNGAGKTVAIVDAFGYTSLDSDLQQFRSFYGLPPCTVANGCLQILNENGQTSPLPPDGAGTGWPTETSLDVDAVSSVCPLCKITVIEGTSDGFSDLATAANTAASLPGVVAISNSYSSGTSDDDPGEFGPLDPDYTHPGIATLAATGDEGGNAPGWPATNPDVVAVGGTSLTQDPSSPRGWNEVVWNNQDGAGNSGCSTFEPQPSWQVGLPTGCSNRAVADLSADADPQTGLALYNSEESEGGSTGFQQFGGTSLSTPLVAGMFALANPLAAGTTASELPYTDPNQSSDFNDITQGSNLVFPPCTQELCQAGPGWDGPTGIGTPNGVAGLSNVASGTVTGTVSGPNGPIAGATIKATASDGSTSGTTTGADGSFTLVLADGTYDVSASAFGFSTQDVPGIVIDTGVTVTQDFTLAAEPDQTISGTVTDASGQGWPMYAEITVDGAPGKVFTNPTTGKYTMQLPQNASYTFHVHAVSLPGYADTTQTVTVGESAVTQNIGLSVDANTCTAPGYTVNFGDGSGTNFEGWTGSTPQDGWSIQNGSSTVGQWSFGTTDPEGIGNETGGSGTFAVINSDFEGPGNSQDTSLVSPVMNFSGDASPSVSFDTAYDGFPAQQGDVDVSTDGGQTWTTVWQADPNNTFPFFTGPQEVNLPQAANQSQVQVRFHFTATFGFWWQLDNIAIDGNLPPGGQNCVASDKGALVEGLVKDNNTQDGLTGAQVSVTNDPNATPAVSVATPDDPALADGFYELFVPSADINASGKVNLTASDGKYDPASVNLAVVAGGATAKNWKLTAGHITVSVSSLSYTAELGGSKSKNLTFTNDGTDPVTVKISEQGSKFTPLLKSTETTPAIRIPVPKNVKPYALASVSSSGAKAANPATSTQPADSPWTPIADQPAPLLDEGSTTLNGLVYEFGGVSNGANTANAAVYHPSTDTWANLAPLPAALEKPNVENVGGEIYIMGGADSTGNIDNTVFEYDPGSNTYTQEASMPTAEWAGASSVLNGLIYVVGGCTSEFCSPVTQAVQIYDPSANTWTTGANYPEADAFSECQGIGNNVICAGGNQADTSAESASTFSYDPNTNAWTQEANMPFTQWGGVSAGANGELQVAQGFSNNAIINSAEQYNPASNTWSALPNANVAVARGGGACGFYSLGGTNVGGGFTGVVDDEVLPGFDTCGSVDVPWLSESTDQFTVAAGASTTITVTADSSQVDQPGTYASALSIQTDSPYTVSPVSVSLDVTPPPSWGKIDGTVTSAADGSPIAGATIQICTQYVAKTGLCGPQSFTLKTGADGSYQLWLSHGFSPMQLVAAKDGFQPQVKVIQLPKGATVTTNFSLRSD